MIAAQHLNISAVPAADAERLASELNCSRLLALLLIKRGVCSAEKAARFFEPSEDEIGDPMLYPGIPQAVEIIADACEQEQKLYICGDYDADGVSAASIMYLGLCRFYKEITESSEAAKLVGWHLPHRFEEGFGLSVKGVDKALAFGASVLITVDCGSSSAKSVAYAKEKGLKVIVTDHHRLEGDISEPDAFVNANLPGHSYPFTKLCGAGTAWKLLCALYGAFSMPRPDELLDLAALATICDMVPLQGENRVLVQLGLPKLQNNDSARLGLRLLMAAFLKDSKDITAKDISYYIGPRINCCGRMDSPDCSFELITAPDKAHGLAGVALMQRLVDKRTEAEEKIMADIHRLMESHPSSGRRFTFFSGEWHKGVVGICAQRVMEETLLPSFIASDPGSGPVTGSARAPEGANLPPILAQCSQYLEAYGGHASACGFTIREGELENFKAALAEAFSKTEKTVFYKKADCVLPLERLSIPMLRELARLEPVGKDCEAPLFLARNVTIEGDMRFVGRNHMGVNFKVSTPGFASGREPIKAVLFRQNRDLASLAYEHCRFDILYNAEIDTWKGKEELSIVVRDFVISDPLIHSLKMPGPEHEKLFGFEPETRAILHEASEHKDALFAGIMDEVNLEGKISDCRGAADKMLVIRHLIGRYPECRSWLAVADSQTQAAELKNEFAALGMEVVLPAALDVRIASENLRPQRILLLSQPLSSDFFASDAARQADKIYVMFNEYDIAAERVLLEQYSLNRQIMEETFKWAALATGRRRREARISRLEFQRAADGISAVLKADCKNVPGGAEPASDASLCPALLHNGTEAENSSGTFNAFAVYAPPVKRSFTKVSLQRALKVLKQLGIFEIEEDTGSLCLRPCSGGSGKSFDLADSPIYRKSEALLSKFDELSSKFDTLFLADSLFFADESQV